MNPGRGEVTQLLHRWSAGDRSVEGELFALVLPDLRRLAGNMMAGERKDHSMQATALMNEAYLRLLKGRTRDWENRRHFYAVAARAMRHLLIDHARSRPAGAKIPIAELEFMLRGRDEQLELGAAISELLDQMELSHPEWLTIIEMRFFAGFTADETAEALQLPLRTMERRFGDARRWLFQKLSAPAGRVPCPPTATNA
jgi:RNA polymerase sigma factor (TIGR02999 family)